MKEKVKLSFKNACLINTPDSEPKLIEVRYGFEKMILDLHHKI